ncbi:hypothetical protein SASPL_112996 [Salvia splendens]|uniref:Uncharacterized protein n=1 Tax=Salvia splendens TaxID=180675 RepID=A0A8X8YC99_SALSN|nr:hypothetical protein SASPL_112996 [Salvia splendens]
MDSIILGCVVVSLAIVVASILICWYKSKHGGKYPPGPRGIPILGYLPFMSSRNMLQQLADLSQQYGPIYKLRLGSKLAVVITSPSLLKQVVRDQDHIFSHRDATAAALAYSRGARDVVFSPPDSSWRAMRKVLVRETQSTAGLDASRDLRRDHIRKAVRSVYDNVGRPFAFGKLVFQTEVSLLMSLMWGGVDQETERLGTEFRAINSEISHLLGKPNVSDLFPVLSRLDLQGVERQMGKVVDSLDKILEEFISQHEKLSGSMLKNEGRKDFLQIVLDHKENKDSDLPTLSRDQIKSLLAVATGEEGGRVSRRSAGLKNKPKPPVIIPHNSTNALRSRARSSATPSRPRPVVIMASSYEHLPVEEEEASLPDDELS